MALIVQKYGGTSVANGCTGTTDATAFTGGSSAFDLLA